MDQADRRNITLIGFSTTGKSSVGKIAAEALGWRFVDTDDLVVEMAGKPISTIFSEDGEDRFRAMEHVALQEALGSHELVIATGGGAILREDNRELMQRRGVIVCLEARPETIYRRLLAESEGENPVVRPLLAGEDPLSRIRYLKEFRQTYYTVADWTIHTDALSHDEVAEEIVRGWRYLSRKSTTGTPAAGPFPIVGVLPQKDWGRPDFDRAQAPPPAKPDVREADAPYCEASGSACMVRMSTASYPIFISWGALDDLGRRMRNAGLKGSASIVSDSGVFPHYGATVEGVLKEAGFDVASYCVSAGEASKSLEGASGIFNWLIQRRAERGQAIVALGGGVVGDMAGFVAATFLRGVPFVQVPTTLLGMVDSSIGGKTAVNHPAGKNLIGAFHQPRLVLADVRTLTTIPQQELVSGWAEVVKAALILDARLFERLEACAGNLLKLDPELSADIIARSAAIKADVVSQDEKETGLRMILNYGHTIGHALEAATTYGSYLHGEAVAVGMMGAALISHHLGLIPMEVVERQRHILERLGLPTTYKGAQKAQLTAAMSLDKKVSGKTVRWILLKAIGEATIRSDVPAELVDSVLDRLRAN